MPIPPEEDREDPGEARGDEPRAAPAIERARTRGVWAAVLGMVLVILAAALTTRCDRQLLAADGGPGAGAGERSGDADDGVAEPSGPPIPVRGRLVRELPLTEAQREAGVSSPSPQPSDDPELDRLLAELEPWTLADPLPGTCRVRAWQGNRAVGAEVRCADDGGYLLWLEPGTEGTVAVELHIDDHLRGVLEIEAEPGADGVDEAQGVELGTVALGPGHRVAGQTVDARGEPLAGVQVQALPQPRGDETLPWRTDSDAEGRFELTSLPYGPVHLRAIKHGYALSVVEAIAPEDAVLMVLEQLIDLRGSVIGDPELLARARVRLEGSSVWPAIELELGEITAGSDPGALASAEFVFERLPDGVYGVEVTVPPAEPSGPEYASVPLENITPDLRVAVVLVPAFRVPVRVVDPEGKPVPGARVTVGYSQIGMLQKVAETNAEGRAQVGPVVPGPYFVSADADGYLPPAPVEVEVGPEGFVGDPQTLVLVRPAKLEGVVVDEDDRPVAGAEVWLDSEVAFTVGEEASRRQLFAAAIGASESSGSLGVTRGAVPDIPLFADAGEQGGSLGAVVSDKDGRFELDLLLPGEHRLWATHGGHAASPVQTFTLRSGELRGGLRLRLREGAPLTGVVRTANGVPIANVQIDLGDGLILTTDERGVFDAGHRRGRQTLILRGAGLIAERVEVDLGDGRGRGVDLEVELAPARGRFEGRAVDGNGQPIANVEVELRPLDGLAASQITWTDARGLYEFEQLAPGLVELVFEHGDYVGSAAQVRVDEGAGLEHEVVLATGWSAQISVRSAVRGDPIAGAELRVQNQRVRTQADGSVTLARLTGELVIVEIEAPGWVGQRLELRADPDGAATLSIVELVEGGSIEGTIDDEIGDPVSAAIIEIRSPAGVKLGEARSDGKGRWRVDGIPAGDVVVRATPPPALDAILAPVKLDSDVQRGELTRAVRLRFDKR
jgi:hypothetical protein